MRAVELFCGMGMSALGLARAGFEIVGACDLNRQAVEGGWMKNPELLPPVAEVVDVDDYEIPPCDLLSGGPVCKAFSPGATLFGTKGGEDPRNTFPHFMRAIARSQPRFVLIENTCGMRRFKGYVSELIRELQELGYVTAFGELDCYDFGVPQHRRRVVFMCWREGERPWEYPEVVTRPQGAPATVADVLPTTPREAAEPVGNDPWPLLLPMTKKGLDYYLRDPRHVAKHPPLIPEKPATTVVANYRKGVPYGVVYAWDGWWLSGPRFAARLQGLPDEYDLNGMAKTPALEAIGNGFPGQVTRALGHELLETR